MPHVVLGKKSHSKKWTIKGCLINLVENVLKENKIRTRAFKPVFWYKELMLEKY